MDPSIARWMAVIDKVSHYELLGVRPEAGADELRHAYQGFAANFHPDAHMHRSAEERTAVNTIFKRGTEAYRVLADPALRARYEEQRAGKFAGTGAASAGAAGTSRGASTFPGARKGEPPKPGQSSNIAGRLEDFVRQIRARPFAQQAEALAKKGEHAKAKLQLKLAISMDPGNPALEAYMKELDVLIQADKKKTFPPR
jgi:DnaJ-class molecular chaperone